MRQLCLELGGDLVKLADAQFYTDLILYMKSLNLPATHFWIGASDTAREGFWKWTDGTPVSMGTPFWATGSGNAQQPAGGTEQNCAYLDSFFDYYFNDFNCSYTLGRPICEE